MKDHRLIYNECLLSAILLHKEEIPFEVLKCLNFHFVIKSIKIKLHSTLPPVFNYNENFTL